MNYLAEPNLVLQVRGKLYRNPSPKSPRMKFQWAYFAQAIEDAGALSVLNVGCASDPLGFRDLAVHFDYDDWSTVHSHFVQGDVHHLDRHVEPQSFHTVILGDVLEHVVDPAETLRQCARAAREVLCITVFAEWRLPGVGQWIEEGQALARQGNLDEGWGEPEDYQRAFYPERVRGGDEPHLCHINQFDEAQMAELIEVVNAEGFGVLEYNYVAEPALHEDHELNNWLIAWRRNPDGEKEIHMPTGYKDSQQQGQGAVSPQHKGSGEHTTPPGSSGAKIKNNMGGGGKKMKKSKKGKGGY